MERYCFTFELVPGQEAEYQRRHDEIWPEMVEALEESGIANYTLFRRGTTVFAYCECEPDAATAFGRMGETEVNKRWSEWFEPVIEALADEEDGRPFEAHEVWHLEGRRGG